MERIDYALSNLSTATGYKVGNFFVYKARYWHIVHFNTHKSLMGDFARRQDALTVIEAMDSPLWDFSSAPPIEVLEELWDIWLAARNMCENVDGILRLPKEDEADSGQEERAQ